MLVVQEACRLNDNEGDLVETEPVRIVFPPALPADSIVERKVIDAIEFQPLLPALPHRILGRPLTVSLTKERSSRHDAFASPRAGVIYLSYLDARDWSTPRLRAVLRHELAHIALDDAVKRRPVPVWFAEGYSVWASAMADCRSETRITVALLTNVSRLPEVFRLTGPMVLGSTNLTYDLYGTAIQYIVAREDTSGLRDLIADVGHHGFDSAARSGLGVSELEFEQEWRDYLLRRYGTLPDGVPCVPEGR